MKKIFLFFLLVPFAFSLTDDFFYSESLLLDIRTKSSFSSAGDVDWVKTSINYFPEESFNQEVISIDTSPSAEFNDTHYMFSFEESEEENEFEVNSRVRTYNKFLPVNKKISFPLDEESEYLMSTDKIDINEDIIRQASMIVEGEDDLYKAVFKLASWTKENINYSLTSATADASKSASWVLENRYGVCDELTNLFIAFCRSLGIPARFVSGISYTNSELFEKPWGLHGWAEVYFPGYGWMPFDPTYGQFGFIDGGHIKLKDSTDSDKTSTRYEWQGSGKVTPKELDIDVNVIETGRKISDPVEINLYPYKKEIDFESYNIIIAEIENKKDNYVGLELELSAPKEVTITGQSKYVALSPRETKKVAWLVKLGDMKKGYIYTFPISARNSLGFMHESDFKASSGASAMGKAQALTILDSLVIDESKNSLGKIDFKCSSGSTAYINESFEVTCNVKNTGNILLERLKICMDSCSYMDLGISQEKTSRFNSRSARSGINVIAITASNRHVSKTSDIEILISKKPELKIGNLDYPEILDYEEFDVSFEALNEGSDANNATVVFYFNERETSWHFESIDSNQKFTVSLGKDAIEKDNKLTISAIYHDNLGRKYTTGHSAQISTNAKGLQKIMLWLNGISNYLDRKIKIAFGRIGI